MRRDNGTSDGEQGEQGDGGELPRATVTRPEDLGWDDSLYEDNDRDRADAEGLDQGRRNPRRQGRDASGEEDEERTGEAGHAGDAPSGTVPGPRASAEGAAGGRSGKTAQRSRRAKKKRRPRWARVLIALSAAMALLVVGLGAAGYFYIRHLDGNLTKRDLHAGDNKLDKAPPNEAGQTPLNILLLGSDARDSDENLALGGARDTVGAPPIADVQMLLHVAADRSNMTVVSIPRDTQVAIPKCTDTQTGEEFPMVESDTINHSLQRGGPGCTVATWEELTGIPIDHFMMLDFSGVVSMADAVGGVPVCVDQNVYDEKSGLRLEAGTSVVKGEQALQWLRTRHGFEDGSDIGRTKAQHQYLSAMVRQLQAGTKLTDPGQLNSLANAATKALTVNNELGSVTRLYDLGEDLRRVPTERINMITMPWVPSPQNPEAHVVPKPGAADELFSLVREDIPLDEENPQLPEDDEEDGEGAEPEETAGPEPRAAEQVEIAVRNGTQSVSLGAVTGRAGVVSAELQALGYGLAAVDDRLTSQPETTLLYPSGDAQAEADADAVAQALGIPARAVRTAPSAELITLVVGNDWREGTRFPEQPERDESAEPQEELDREQALKGDNEEACMTVNPIFTW